MDRLEEFTAELLEINPNIDIELIERAYRKAEQMHEGQLRKSGEPYLIHPVEVAKILADLGMDERTIVAGLLHDAVEDTPYSKENLQNDFGSEVALLVDGVTKLGSLKFESKEERQAENLRKMFLAMSKDIRVLIIKLSDRLHNLRTINYMNEEQILDKCQETLDIYAPLANRLGIYTIKFELEDIALKYLDSDAYYELVDLVKSKKGEREENINSVIGEIKEALDDLDLEYEISGRSKHFYSIYRKMKYQNKSIEEIFDLTAIRIIVDTVKDCYSVLGIVHTLWRPLPGRFKDYIAMPKPNMYQSLHTTVAGDKGQPFEIQIRTKAMHRVAEYGIAAHWKYKEGVTEDQEEMKLAWLRQTLEWQNDMNDPREFMETLRMDLFSNQVFVFTPKGDVMELPAGSTPLDFAFKIHSDVGAKCSGAKVNGKMVPIDYELENGQIVDILTSKNSKGPSIDWLKIVKSSNAKSKIRQWLKKQDRDENVGKGKELLEKSVRRKGYDPKEMIKISWVNKASKNLKYSNAEDMYTALSYGGVPVTKIIQQLVSFYEEEHKEELEKQKKTIADEIAEAEKNKIQQHKKNRKYKEHSNIKVKGVDNLLVRLAKCCSPVPGDDIVGFITKGRGVTVHRTDCPNITGLPESEKGRMIEVQWDIKKKDITFNADIFIKASDRRGLFSDISRICLEMDVNIHGVNLKTNNDGTVSVTMTLQITNTEQMKNVLRKLKAIEGVAEIYRSNN